MDAFVKKCHPEANFLQTSQWGKVYELSGFKVYYWGFYDKAELIGSCLAILQPAKRGRYLEIPGGPLLNWQDNTKVRTILDQIAREAKSLDCVFVRMRPNIKDSREIRKCFSQDGLSPSPMHLHAENTVMLDLELSLDEILKNMRRQTRYEVKRAAKLGIKVDAESSPEIFNKFYDLQLETAKRQNFIPSPRNFIVNQQKAFLDNAKIYVASLDGKVLAMGLIIFQGNEAVYHEAASSPEGRHYPGAYALQWQVIQDAKAKGMKRYNLFGIAPANVQKHRYAGVTTFKKGFGGEVVNYLPAHDLVIKPLHYKITKIIEVIRKRYRHL